MTARASRASRSSRASPCAGGATADWGAATACARRLCRSSLRWLAVATAQDPIRPRSTIARTNRRCSTSSIAQPWGVAWIPLRCAVRLPASAAERPPMRRRRYVVRTDSGEAGGVAGGPSRSIGVSFGMVIRACLRRFLPTRDGRGVRASRLRGASTRDAARLQRRRTDGTATSVRDSASGCARRVRARGGAYTRDGPAKDPPDESRAEPLKRLGGGRWQTRDGRFTIEPGDGRWSVVDAAQTDELGLQRVRGPFGSLADAKAAIAEVRDQPVPTSPL